MRIAAFAGLLFLVFGISGSAVMAEPKPDWPSGNFPAGSTAVLSDGKWVLLRTEPKPELAWDMDVGCAGQELVVGWGGQSSAPISTLRRGRIGSMPTEINGDYTSRRSMARCTGPSTGRMVN